MTLTLFVALYLVEMLIFFWTIRWNGAEWMEYRFRAGIFFGYFAIGWNAEQIKLYAWLCGILSTIYFVAGLIKPELRFL
ncbi:MAG: hypothetical protein OEZ43_05435 [Gammaproteobacteria bacterium]|nr:hypothetical protein [Gammaproteobacteria bacterium]